MSEPQFIDNICCANIESHDISTNPSLLDDSNSVDQNNLQKIHETLAPPADSSEELKPSNDSYVKHRHRGTLYIRIGPMFSGKSTWLNGELTQLADKRFSVLKINHSDDTRTDVEACDNSGSTHNSSYKSLSNKITCVRACELKGIDVSRYHVIGIDEAQFFPDLFCVIKDWVENQVKHIRVAGLDGDIFKCKFGQTLDLIPICDEVIKLTASCKICLDELEHAGFHGNILAIQGPFTKRLGHSKEQKIVGGANEYIPVCRFHHAYNSINNG